jgi:hypothetical protein
MALDKTESPIALAILDHSPEIGGAESSLLTFLRHLDRRKLDGVVILTGEGAFSERLQKERIAVHIIPVSRQLLRLKRGYGWKSFFSFLTHLVGFQPLFIRLCLFLRRHRFELVMTNTVKAHLYGSLAAFLCGIPVVWRFHDILSTSDFNPWWIRLITLFGNVFPKKILAVSETTRTHLIGSGVRREKVGVVFNGVDEELLTAPGEGKDLRQEFNLGEKARLVGCVGRLIPQKGQRSLVMAIPEILREYPETFFFVVGDAFHGETSYKEELMKAVKNKRIEGHVKFTGFRMDVGEVMRCLDIMVYPSVAPESFGLSILEGMYLGKPVIASRIGGVTEIVEDGVTGILVEPNHPEQIADRILYLFRNKEICDRIGRKAREVAVRRFPLKNYVEAMEAACRELASPGVRR